MGQGLVKLNNATGCNLREALSLIEQKQILPELKQLCRYFFKALEPEYYSLFDLEDLQFTVPEEGLGNYFFLEVLQFHDFIGFNRVHQWIRVQPPDVNCITIRFWDVGPDTNLTHVCRTDNPGVAAEAFGIANELNIE